MCGNPEVTSAFWPLRIFALWNSLGEDDRSVPTTAPHLIGTGTGEKVIEA
jgi:hypothetical protein